MNEGTPMRPTDQVSDLATQDGRDALRELHRVEGGPGDQSCTHCDVRWPCDSMRRIEALEASLPVPTAFFADCDGLVWYVVARSAQGVATIATFTGEQRSQRARDLAQRLELELGSPPPPDEPAPITPTFRVGDVVETIGHAEWGEATITAVDVVYTINGGQDDEDTFLEGSKVDALRLLRRPGARG